jgi:tRNA(fMet)-specific endonuclease VapC
VGDKLGGDSSVERVKGSILRRLLLDTTFLIDAQRATIDLDEVISDDDDVAIAAITVAEMRVGVELAKGKIRTSREALLNEVLDEIPILDYTVDVAQSHAELLVEVRRQGRPRGAHDLIIAATSLSHSRIVVSADRSAFEDLPGVAVLKYR